MMVPLPMMPARVGPSDFWVRAIALAMSAIAWGPSPRSAIARTNWIPVDAVDLVEPQARAILMPRAAPVGVEPEPGLADTGDLQYDLPDLFTLIGKAAQAAGRGWILLIASQDGRPIAPIPDCVDARGHPLADGQGGCRSCWSWIWRRSRWWRGSRVIAIRVPV